MLVDTHCHLDFPEFKQDRDEVIRRAKDSGIGYIVNIGTSLEGSRKSLELTKEYDFIYATVGIHPHEADIFDSKIKDALVDLARKEKVVAIGEIGLDYYRNYSKVENQKALFSALLKLAKDLDLPVVIHSRLAADDTLQFLKEAMPMRAVMHCFSEEENFLKECLELGFFISFTCNITYPAKLSNRGRDPDSYKIDGRDKKAARLREMVRLAPLDRLLLETDAPFLPPEGLRGKRNEPANVKYLAFEIATIKGLNIEDIARITTDNARNFFNLK